MDTIPVKILKFGPVVQDISFKEKVCGRCTPEGD